MTSTATAAEAKSLDELFDEGADLTPYVVPGSVSFPGREEQRRVNMNMPKWLVDAVDAKARSLGANRQSYINMTLADSLK